MAERNRRRATATARFQQLARKEGTDLSLVTHDVGQGVQPKAVDMGYDIYEFEAAGTPPTAAWLNKIRTGILDEQKIGNTVLMRSLEIRGRVDYFDPNDGSMQPFAGMVRMVIVYDRQPNGVKAAWGDVFASRTTSGTPDSSMLAFQDLNNLARFVVLWDKLWDATSLYFCTSIPASGFTTAACSPGAIVDVRLELGEGLTARYNSASTGAFTDVLSGALLAFFVCDDDLAGVPNLVKFKGDFRLHFEE